MLLVLLIADPFDISLTSASDHALPPPVDTVFLCLWSIGAWTSDIFDEEFDLIVTGF